MNRGKKKINVVLHMKINDQGMVEEYTRRCSGQFVHRNVTRMLTFEELTEEKQRIHNFVTVQEGRVTMKRTGEIRMNQIFKPQQWTETMFRHPYGMIHMETFTEKIDYQEEERGGKLAIHYNVKLQGQAERKHYLEIIFEQEEDA